MVIKTYQLMQTAFEMQQWVESTFLNGSVIKKGTTDYWKWELVAWGYDLVWNDRLTIHEITPAILIEEWSILGNLFHDPR